MSLPPATRILSDRPPKDAVAEPVDSDRLHEDLDKKLRLYGVIQAFRAGKLPDNAQADEALEYIGTHSPVDINALSPEGAVLVRDIRALIGTARQIVKEKNNDELVQNFIWHTRGVDHVPDKRGPNEASAITADSIKADGQQAAHHLRALLSLVIRNAEARKMLSDFSVIGRDLLVKSADLIRPDEEILQHVDEPASSDEPIFARGDKTSSHAREQEETVERERRDLSKTDKESKASDNHTGSADVPQTKGEKGKASIINRLTGLKEKVPSEYRQRAKGQVDRARHFVKDEYFPKERRERFLFRAKKVILECQKEESYQESIQWFLDNLPQYGREGMKKVPQEKGIWNQSEFQLVMTELKELLTRFANGTSPQPAIDSFKKIMQLAKEDVEMRRWIGRIQDWMRRVLLEPGYVVDVQCKKNGSAIREEGKKFYDEKYKSQFDEFFDALRTWCTELTKDPLNKQFGEDWAQLTRDLLFDNDGHLAWKPQLWADIRRVIVPQLVEKIGYLPIPRAEYSDQNLDLVIENLALSGKNLFPNIVSVEVHNYARFSPYTAIRDYSRHNFVITLGQIQADLRDVMFNFEKKTGVPKLCDSGLADILLGGSGITATIHLQSAPRNSGSLFFVRSVHVELDALKFRIRDSHHDALYNFIAPIATVAVKWRIKRALSDSIRNVFETINQSLARARDRMDDAKLKEGETKVGALKDYIKQTRRKRDKRAKSEGHFRVPKRNRLLLPNMGHANSWFSRQQEEDQIATEGHEWRSKAFTLVPNSSPTSDVTGTSRMPKQPVDTSNRAQSSTYASD